MLQSIRTKTASWTVKLLFALLVLSFAVWGIEDVFRGGSTSDIVIKVEDIEIPARQVNERLQSEISTLRQRFGQSLTTEQARQLGLLNTVIDSMATDAVFLAFARDRGIVVTDAMVRAAIAEEPAFRGPDGAFSRDQFVAALRSVGMTEEGYVQTMRRELMRQNVINATLASASAPDVLVDRLYRHRAERRVADLLFVANSAMQDVAQPTEVELAEFHKTNDRRYLAPEYRSVSFVTLKAEALAAEILVPDEELRREYESRAASYTTPWDIIRVAVGPRFLNGYSSRHGRPFGYSVAVGPRFLNGYSLKVKLPSGAVVAVDVVVVAGAHATRRDGHIPVRGHPDSRPEVAELVNGLRLAQEEQVGTDTRQVVVFLDRGRKAKQPMRLQEDFPVIGKHAPLRRRRGDRC